MTDQRSLGAASFCSPVEGVRDIALADLLANVAPGHREEAWSWEDEERDIAIRLCLCCGKPGHHQATVEALIATGRLPARASVGEDGRLHDGHHRVVAAMHLGIERVEIETKAEADSRWQSDHGGTMWELRRFGDVHPGEAWAYVQNVRQQARDFAADALAEYDLLFATLADALSALKYIEQRYGRLDGVGWGRVLGA
jgi:hypothetical protein